MVACSVFKRHKPVPCSLTGVCSPKDIGAAELASPCVELSSTCVGEEYASSLLTRVGNHAQEGTGLTKSQKRTLAKKRRREKGKDKIIDVGLGNFSAPQVAVGVGTSTNPMLGLSHSLPVAPIPISTCNTFTLLQDVNEAVLAEGAHTQEDVHDTTLATQAHTQEATTKDFDAELDDHLTKVLDQEGVPQVQPQEEPQVQSQNDTQTRVIAHTPTRVNNEDAYSSPTQVEDSSTQGDASSAAPISLGLQTPATIPTVSPVAHHTKAPVTKRTRRTRSASEQSNIAGFYREASDDDDDSDSSVASRVAIFESAGRNREFAGGHGSPPKTSKVPFGGRITRSQVRPEQSSAAVGTPISSQSPSLDSFRLRLGFDSAFAGVDDKLWLFWNSDLTLSFESDSDQSVSVSCIHATIPSAFWVSFVYAKTRERLRVSLWAELCSLSDKVINLCSKMTHCFAAKLIPLTWEGSARGEGACLCVLDILGPAQHVHLFGSALLTLNLSPGGLGNEDDWSLLDLVWHPLGPGYVCLAELRLFDSLRSMRRHSGPTGGPEQPPPPAPRGGVSQPPNAQNHAQEGTGLTKSQKRTLAKKRRREKGKDKIIDVGLGNFSAPQVAVGVGTSTNPMLGLSHSLPVAPIPISTCNTFTLLQDVNEAVLAEGAHTQEDVHDTTLATQAHTQEATTKDFDAELDDHLTKVLDQEGVPQVQPQEEPQVQSQNDTQTRVIAHTPTRVNNEDAYSSPTQVEDSSTQGDASSAAPISLGLQTPATIPTVSPVAHHTKAPVTKRTRRTRSASEQSNIAGFYREASDDDDDSDSSVASRVAIFESAGRNREFAGGHGSPPKTSKVPFGGRITRSQVRPEQSSAAVGTPISSQSPSF
nr:uncharacterized protein LOC109150827 [Ipomoea batatas]